MSARILHNAIVAYKMGRILADLTSGPSWVTEMKRVALSDYLRPFRRHFQYPESEKFVGDLALGEELDDVYCPALLQDPGFVAGFLSFYDQVFGTESIPPMPVPMTASVASATVPVSDIDDIDDTDDTDDTEPELGPEIDLEIGLRTETGPTPGPTPEPDSEPESEPGSEPDTVPSGVSPRYRPRYSGGGRGPWR